jgi:hypothetical protein
MKLLKYFITFSLSFLYLGACSKGQSNSGEAKVDEGGQSTRGSSGGTTGQEYDKTLPVPNKREFDVTKLNFAGMDKSEYVTCEMFQSYIMYGTAVMSFLQRTGFEFTKKDGTPLDLSKFDFQKVFDRYKFIFPGQTPRANEICFDARKQKGPIPEYALIILLEKNTMFKDAGPKDEGRNDMARNFSNTGKIYVFTEKWPSSEILKSTEECKKYAIPGNESMSARNCIFLTHVLVSFHEAAHANGLKLEETGLYEASAPIFGLYTLNDAVPNPRSVKVAEHIITHYLKAFQDYKKIYARAMKWTQFLGETLKDPDEHKFYDPANRQHFKEDYITAVSDLQNAFNRLHNSEQNLTMLLELSIGGAFDPQNTKFNTLAGLKLSEKDIDLILDAKLAKSVLEKYKAGPFKWDADDSVDVAVDMDLFAYTYLQKIYLYQDYIFRFYSPFAMGIPSRRPAWQIPEWSCKLFPGGDPETLRVGEPLPANSP